jgi:hypothetical protein
MTGRGVRTAAADRQAADEHAELVTAAPIADAGASVPVALTGLALPSPLGAGSRLEPRPAEPAVQVMRRRASGASLLIGDTGQERATLDPSRHLATAPSLDALRRQAAAVTGRQSGVGTGLQAAGGGTTIRRTLQEAIDWGARRQQPLTFTSQADVEQQIMTWSAGNAAARNLANELQVQYYNGQPAALADLDGADAGDMSDVYDSENDSTYEQEGQVAASAAPKKTSGLGASHAAGPSNPTHSFWETHKKKGGSMELRKPADGPVELEQESIYHVQGSRIDRPVRAQGLIAPTVTTGRLSAPEPASGIRIGQLPEGATPKFHLRNTGTIDADKGHVFALELGGPDVPENIVPQFSLFQQSGQWRKAEVAALAKAKEQKGANKAEFRVLLRYKPYAVPEQGTLKSLTHPQGFTMEYRVVAKTGAATNWTELFSGENVQDERQFKRANKTLDEADELSASDDEESEED